LKLVAPSEAIRHPAGGIFEYSAYFLLSWKSEFRRIVFDAVRSLNNRSLNSRSRIRDWDSRSFLLFDFDPMELGERNVFNMRPLILEEDKLLILVV